MAIKTIFLDRDGVINKEVSYLHKIKDFEFIKGVFEACKYFLDLNYSIIIISNQSGRSNIMSRLENYGIKIDSKDPKVQKILNEVKEREFTGYSYDGADASFELLANKLLGKLPEYLKVKNYNVNVKKDKELKTTAEVTFVIDGKEIHCTGEGNGPVNALDLSLIHI